MARLRQPRGATRCASSARAWRARGAAVARPNRLREKIAAGKTCVGPLFQEFWSPELFEFCAMAGFDFVIADGEHAGVDPQAVRNLARLPRPAARRPSPACRTGSPRSSFATSTRGWRG